MGLNSPKHVLKNYEVRAYSDELHTNRTGKTQF